MNGCKCGCATYKEHIQGISFRARIPAPKQTVDHTDQTINTVTEHWDDRQDVNVNVVKPVMMKRSEVVEGS